jgi:serine/threonine protein phosphatase PrpC
LHIKMAGASDIGLVRKMNQDSFHFDGATGIAIVADGIGGRKGGEVASSMAVTGMRDAFLQTDYLRHEEIHTFLTSSVDRINRQIIERGINEVKIKGMGTTLNFLMFVGDRLHIAHVGDSRSYMYYRGQMWQLTVDHNIETFISRGWMRPENVSPGTQEGALVRSIGLTDHCEVDIYDMKLREGQIFLTCSDGLTNMVNERKIAKIIEKEEANINKIPKLLVEEAKKGGGKDNITLVISQVCGS